MPRIIILNLLYLCASAKLHHQFYKIIRIKIKILKLKKKIEIYFVIFITLSRHIIKFRIHVVTDREYNIGYFAFRK